MTADAAIRIVLLTLQGCKLHTHDHRLPPFACHRSRGDSEDVHHHTCSQPVYSRSRLSELLPLESPVGSTIRTQTMQVTESPPLADGFPASQVHPHIYMMHPFFFYAHAKWKARIYCDSWTSTQIEVLG